jgi:hypothetical protein
MLLNIILIIVVFYIFYRISFKNKEPFDFGSSMFVEGNFISPNCSSGTCTESDFNLNNINLIMRYADNNNFKAKQNYNSILKPNYLF